MPLPDTSPSAKSSSPSSHAEVVVVAAHRAAGEVDAARGRSRARPAAPWGSRPRWISAATRMSSSMRRFSRLSSSRRTFSILAAATLASAVTMRRSSSLKESAPMQRVEVDEADDGVLPPLGGVNHRGAQMAERMPVERMLSWALKAASSRMFGMSSDSWSSSTLAGDGAADAASIGLALAAARGLDHRLAAGRPPGAGWRRARRAPPRRAGSGSCSNSSGSGRCSSSVAWRSLSTLSTRFCRCSSSGSMAGLVLDVGELAGGEDARALGRAPSSSGRSRPRRRR